MEGEFYWMRFQNDGNLLDNKSSFKPCCSTKIGLIYWHFSFRLYAIKQYFQEKPFSENIFQKSCNE